MQHTIKKQLILVSALVLCVNLAGCSDSKPISPTSPKLSAKLTELKGDVLGMDVSEYKKKHRQCFFHTVDFCIGDSTIAGESAIVTAYFFEEHLYKITYSVNKASAPQLLQSLRDKFGDPQSADGVRAKWIDGTATMEYTDLGDAALVELSHDELRDKEWEYQKKKSALTRKNDL